MPVSRVSISPHFMELASLVGQALDQWSHVEMEIASLFQYASEIPDAMVAQVTMATITSFDARVQICNNVLPLVSLTPLHAAYWKWLYNRLTKLSKKRNEIAHFSIVEWESEWGDGSELQKGSDKTEWRLVPYFSLGRLVMDQSLGLSAAQIRERGQLFNTLWRDVAWLRAEIQVLKGKLAANPISVPDRVRELRDAADQTPKDS